MTVEERTFRTDDLQGLQRALEAAGLHRDSRLGGILHPGKISFREASARDSLHVLIDGNRVSAHVDRFSPLHRRGEGDCRYSWPRVVAHNIAFLVDDMSRRVRGHRGNHRCNLECEVVWVDDGHGSETPSAVADCPDPDAVLRAAIDSLRPEGSRH